MIGNHSKVVDRTKSDTNHDNNNRKTKLQGYFGFQVEEFDKTHERHNSNFHGLIKANLMEKKTR
jgi:hypothetical protein